MRPAPHGLAPTLLLVAAFLAAPAAASPQSTSQPAAEQSLRGLVQAMNAGDRPTLDRFVRAHFVSSGEGAIPAEERVARLTRLQSLFGTLEIRSIDSSSASRASATVQSTRTEAWRRLTVFLEDAPPHRISRVGLGPARDPSHPTRTLSDEEIAAERRSYVERMAQRDVFSGTVMLARNGKPIYQAAVGEANKDFGVPNAIDTKFNLGSMNKMFTAVAIMQLVEAGKVSLTDTLGKFLPVGSMRPDVLSKVRIEHLLTHTSGLGSYFTPEWDKQSRARYRTVDDWMSLVKDDQLQFEPGTRWRYSNTGMLVLGKVIEAASGKDYFDYIRERLYSPAGMTNSDSYDLDRVTRNLAVGYEREADGWRNNIFAHVIRGGPAGGGYSTVEDLTRFAQALREGKLVSAASMRLLTSPKAELSSPEYGYGFGIEEGGRIVGHGGGFLGISAQLDIYTEGGYTLAVLSNYGGGAMPIVEKARALIAAGSPRTAVR